MTITVQVTSTTHPVSESEQPPMELGADSLMASYAASQCSEAFSELYQQTYKTVRNYAAKYVRHMNSRSELLDEIVQEVYLRASQQYEDFIGKGVIAWLFTFARNIAMPLYRNARRHPTQSIPDAVLDNLAERPNEQLNDLLHRCSPEARSILTAHYLEGESFVSIAERNGIAVTTLKSRVRQYLIEIRESSEIPSSIMAT